MKRILSLILVMLMVLSSTVVLADSKQFSDVPDNYKYGTAIYTLTDFGIIKGDAGADTFRPTSNISREEFSVIMVRCLGLGDLVVDISEYPFTDVTPATCADWSINATKIAYDQGIIKGMGDGTFAPKAFVTYEQAVKMIVCALGYEPHSIAAGGWPNGYISVARELGITKRAEAPQEDPATRDIIAQLIYNSLDIDLMTSYIDSQGNEKYTSVSGQTLLTQKLNYTKATGVITATKATAIDTQAIGLDEDEVKIDYINKFNVGTTNAQDYLGQTVTYYYSESDGEKTLKSVKPTSDNKIIELQSDSIKGIDSTKIEYYEDPNDTSTLDFYPFDTPAYLVYNGAHAELNNSVVIESGNVKLIDNDADGSVNVIIVDAATTIVADAVDTTNFIVYDAYNQANKIELNPNSGDIITITKYGSKVEFTAIQKGDVLLVYQSTNPTGAVTKNVKILTDSISGTITQLSSDYTEVVINGVQYKLSKKFINYIETTPSFSFKLDNSVTCYLDASNQIVAAKVTAVSASANYKIGYMIAADEDKKSETLKIRMITQEGSNVIYTSAEKIRINGTTYNYSDAENVLASTPALNVTNVDPEYSDASGYNMSQLVKYSINTSGKIDNIVSAKTTGDIDTDLVLSKTCTTDKYSLSSSMLGSGVSIDSSTRIFFVPSNRSNYTEYSVRNKSSLINNKNYTFETYNATATNVASIVVIYGQSSSISVEDPGAPLVIVNSVTQALHNGSNAEKLECYENGYLKTYYSSDIGVLSSVKTGDVIRIQFNGSNLINNIKIMYPAGSSPAFGSRLVRAGENNTTMNAEYLTVYGHVYGRDTDRMTISLYDIDNEGNLNNTDLYSIPFSGETKFFAYNSETKKLEPAVISAIAGYASAKTGASKIFAYTSYGLTKFVIIVK